MTSTAKRQQKYLSAEEKQQKRLSRRLTVDTHEPYVSIRPIIRRADKEAACVLADAYVQEPVLDWLAGTIKDESKRLEVYQEEFKNVIREAARISRELAIQVNGCKGVLVWSEGSLGGFGPRAFVKFMGGLLNMKATKHQQKQQQNLKEMRRKVLGARPHVMIHFLGVLPNERNQHLGKALVKHVLAKARNAQMPVFAEVWGDANASYFKKLGFDVCAEKQLSSKLPTFYYVVREPTDDISSPGIMSPVSALQLEPPREDTLQQQ